MAAKTITGTITTGYALTNPAYTPFYIAAGASLTNTAGTALLNSLAAGWIINNAGTVAATGATGNGIAAASGGTVTNAAPARVAGYGFGVSIGGTGSVANHGTITASQTSGNSSSYLAATHQLTALSAGIAVAGGSVSNYAGATVTAPLVGIAVNGTGIVVNAGVVQSGTTRTSGYGVMLGGGGSVTNQTGGTISAGRFGVVGVGQLAVSNQSGGSISSLSIGVANFYKNGTVTNQGSILGSASSGIELVAGGTITNLAGASVSGGHAGVYVFNQPGTLFNQGFVGDRYILQNPASYYHKQIFLDGVSFSAGGLVANNGGAIIGHSYGVRISSAAGTVTNAGTIISYRYRGGAGVQLTVGGTVTNAAGGLIAGEWIGVQLGQFNAPGAPPQGPLGTITLVNGGSIVAADGIGDGAAVWMYGPGTIINQQGGVIGGATNGTITGNGGFNGVTNGGFGIVAYYQTTVVNYGSIGGVKYNAAAYHAGTTGPKQFAFDAANKSPTNTIINLFRIAPGSSFGGPVKGSNGNGSATLELLSGASTGTVVAFGTIAISASQYSGYLGFGAIKVDDGARWNLGGTVAAGQTVSFAAGGTGALTIASPAQFHGTIASFGAGDTLTLAGLTTNTSVTASPLPANDLLTIGGTGIVLQFDSGVTGLTFSSSVVGGGTEITVSCFAAGTAIQTPDGPAAVESLSPGQRVMTHRGEPAEIVWIGQRAVDCRQHPDPARVHPVRVRADAFGPGLPARDLWLSPDHAVFVERVLIPIHRLIDGDAIRQVQVPEITYYHIELAEHDVILAESLPVESYLDTGDRANFSNSGGAVRLFPDFSARMWEMAGCAPLITTGPILERAKQAVRLAAAAARMGVPLQSPLFRPSGPRLNNRYTYY